MSEFWPEIPKTPKFLADENNPKFNQDLATTRYMNKIFAKEIIAGLVPCNVEDLDDHDCLYELGFDDMDMPSLSQRLGVWGLNDEMTVGEVLDAVVTSKSNEKEKEA